MHVEQFSPAFLGRWEGNGEINCGDPNRPQKIPTTHSGRPCSASLGIFGGRVRSLTDAFSTLSLLFSKQTIPASLTEKGGQKKRGAQEAVPTGQPRRKKFTGSSESKRGVGTLSHGGWDVYNWVMALDHQEMWAWAVVLGWGQKRQRWGKVGKSANVPLLWRLAAPGRRTCCPSQGGQQTESLRACAGNW